MKISKKLKDKANEVGENVHPSKQAKLMDEILKQLDVIDDGFEKINLRLNKLE